jgi:hypothetical protein
MLKRHEAAEQGVEADEAWLTMELRSLTPVFDRLWSGGTRRPGHGSAGSRCGQPLGECNATRQPSTGGSPIEDHPCVSSQVAHMGTIFASVSMRHGACTAARLAAGAAPPPAGSGSRVYRCHHSRAQDKSRSVVRRWPCGSTSRGGGTMASGVANRAQLVHTRPGLRTRCCQYGS